MDKEQILQALEPYVPTLIDCVRTGWRELESIPLETRHKFHRCARANVMHALTTCQLKVAFVGNDDVRYVEQGLLRIVQISSRDGAILLRVKKLDEDLRTSNVLDSHQLVWDFGEPVKAVVNLGYTVVERGLESYLNQVYLQQEDENGKLWDKSVWRADLEALNATEAVSLAEHPTPGPEVGAREGAKKNLKRSSS